MATKSPSSKAIDSVIRSGPHQLLKAAEYKKQARSFHRRFDEVFAVIQFQASQWNFPESARFTINLNLVLPYFHEKWCTIPFPKNPASAAPVSQQRIGGLMPSGKDHWWQVTPDSHVEEIANDVTAALDNYGLPYISSNITLDPILSALDNGQRLSCIALNQSVVHAILLCYKGHHNRAQTVLTETYARNQHAGFRKTLLRVANALELTIAP